MRVGILGGGQLGVMLAEAVARHGAHPLIYDPDPMAPARSRVPDTTTASFEDVSALGAFLARCDVVSYERENLPLDALRAAGRGARFVPDLRALEVAQDRAQEKAFLVRHDLPCVRHLSVQPGDRLEDACEGFGWPAIAKTTRGGYDGRGQRLVRGSAQAVEARQAYPDASWVLEEPVSILTEASCIVARSEREEVVFPVVENLHRHHVLDRSLVPGRLSDDLCGRLTRLAVCAARRLDVCGLVAVEFFIVRPEGASAADEGQVIINELAPRPHNSGHVLSRACTFGQFDALARVLVGAPIGNPRLVGGHHCMVNLFGDVWLAQGSQNEGIDLSAWSRVPEVIDIHLYGKLRPAPRRKMGHAVVAARTPDEALAAADQLRTLLAAPADAEGTRAPAPPPPSPKGTAEIR